MATLQTCPRCEGFLPSTGVCPNCGARPARAFSGVLAVAGAAVSALTLMACYGAPPCDYGADGGSDPNSCYDPIVEDAGVDGGQQP